jgi:hypothetical protein
MQEKATIKKQLKMLKQAYASGILRVRYGDTEITYQSMVDMKKAIILLERKIGISSSKIHLFQHEYSSGL